MSIHVKKSIEFLVKENVTVETTNKLTTFTIHSSANSVLKKMRSHMSIFLDKD